MKKGDEYKHIETGIIVSIDECNDERVKASHKSLFVVCKEDMTLAEFAAAYEFTGVNNGVPYHGFITASKAANEIEAVLRKHGCTMDINRGNEIVTSCIKNRETYTCKIVNTPF